MNLVKKLTATAALVALTSTLFTTGVSAAGSMEVEAANKLANAGIINDHSDNTALYELNRNVLRQEIGAVARGLAGIEKTTTCENLFKDVSATVPNTWACYTVEALRKADMIAANEYFNPERNITKAESVGMVVKAAYGDEYMYDKADSASWQEQVVNFASSKGLVDSFTDYDALATRGFVFKAAANAHTEDDASKLICELLGTCDDKDDKDTGTGTETTDPVVVGDDMLLVELSPETPANGNVAAGAARTKMLAFDVSAGNSDVTLESAKLKFTGLGDSKVISDLSIYEGLQKVTKGAKKFYSDDTSDLSFERDVVIKAGETKTLFVTATIAKEASNYNQTLQISLIDLEASSTVKGDDLVGSTLTPVLVSNVGKVDLKTRKVTNTLNVGEVSTLADFSLDEESDKESVTVKSITFEVGGSVDSDDLADLALYADGEKVDASFMVKNSEIEAELAHTIEKDKKVNYLLKGAITGSVNDTIMLSFEENAIYVIGDSSGVSINVDTTNEELSESKIEGSEINIAFNRSEIDEAKPGADDVVLGNIDLSSAADYNIKKLQVTIENSSTQLISDVVKTLELKGLVYDKVVNEQSTTATYTFEDIDLQEGVAKKLPLTLDLLDGTAISGANLTVNVKVIEVKDEDNNKTYTSTASGDLNVSKILSSNSFTAKTVEVKTASLELVSTEVNDTELVLGNGVKTVLYKGKLSVGDADKITLRNIDFIPSGSNNLPSGINISDIVSDATLNIGGKTFKADVETNRLDFNSINANIAAGADNVEMLLVATLKDNGSITGSSNVLAVQVDTASIDVDDGEGDTLPTASVTTSNANNQLTKTTLEDRGDFFVAATQNGDNKDKMKDVVLAGTNSVNLGEVEIQADKEAAKVKKLTFELEALSVTSVTLVSASVATTTANVVETTAQKQVMTVTIPTNLTTGTFSIDVDSTAVTGSDINTLAAAIEGTSNVATATVSGNVITVTAATAGTGYTLTNPQFNGSVESSITISTTTPNTTTTSAVAAVKTITFAGPITSDLTAYVTVDGVELSEAYNTDSATTLGNLATDIAGQPGVATATVAGNVITVTAATAGTDFILTNAGTKATNVEGDFSSTFENVKLVDGSKVLADNAILSYVGGKTLITFKDFTLDATDSKRDAMLVADIVKYTTSGSETSATLGKFEITAYDGVATPNTDLFDVEGVSSQEDMDATINNNTTEAVTIVPVTVTASIDNKFGRDDQYAKIKFTINKGNNNLDSDDIVVSAITMADGVASVVVRNDDNATIASSQTVAANADVVFDGGADLTINNGDTYEFKLDTAGEEVRIKANGIQYTVGGGSPYKITNDSVIDLGSYTD